MRPSTIYYGILVTLLVCSCFYPALGARARRGRRGSSRSSAKSSATSKPNDGGGVGESSGGGTGTYKDAMDAVVDGIVDSSAKTDAMVDSLMDDVSGEHKPPMTHAILQNLVKEHSVKPQQSGTRSITLRADQGFKGISSFQPSGWQITETTTGPTNKGTASSEEKVPAYSYPRGVGPVLMNNCVESDYSSKSPCATSKILGEGRMTCPKLLEATSYIGVGFDGRGFYKIESRRASLVQRTCNNGAMYKGADIPDSMTVFGIYETESESRCFQSASDYLSYIREKAGMSNQKNLFKSESSQFSKSSSSGFSLGLLGTIAGAATGAYFGGPQGAQMGANLGNAIGSSFSFGSGQGSSSMSSTRSGSSQFESHHSDQASSKQGSSSEFFASMYINVILYQVSLDTVKPFDINLAALKDYMSLPVSYYSVGADVKYQNFILRWGTHFIRAAKFGGQLKITKTAKSDKSLSIEQFSSISQTEFQSMFASLQSKRTQESKSSGFLFWKKKSTKTKQTSTARSESEHRRSSNQNWEQSKDSSGSEFTNTVVEAQGGTPLIAEALVDFYTPAFRPLYRDWLLSISDNIKPFEFQLRSVDQLFNLNMDDLFPSGTHDFGCLGAKDKVIEIDPITKKRYYLDDRASYVNNKTIYTQEKVYCKYKNLNDFKTGLERRRRSLEKAVSVYMAEGPFPTSSFELSAGQPGCEEDSLTELDLLKDSTQHMTFAELKKAPFLIAFDMPMEIPNLVTPQAKYTMLYRNDRWFAVEPPNHLVHLYDGCQLTGYRPAEAKVCFRNIILTYEEKNGFFHVQPSDFGISKQRIPTLPTWLSGTTVARVKRIQDFRKMYRKKFKDSLVAIPCNVKWMNSHRLDPDKDVNCVHFSAASEGDMFVVFSSIPKDHTTWYYLQINKEGVSFYHAMKLEKRDVAKGMGILGDRNLYQTMFVCVVQVNNSVLMQYGKANADSDLGKVYSAYKFFGDNQYSQLSFYTFGSGTKSASLVDIRLTLEMPEVKCLNSNYKHTGKFCILNCHSECLDCTHAQNDRACFACARTRVETKNVEGSDGSTVTQCVPACPPGYQLSPKKRNLCVKCTIGTFKNQTGNHDCEPCPPGSFNRQIGALNCTLCSPGFYTNKFGSPICYPCRPGTATNVSGTPNCKACDPGSFNRLIGALNCTLCSPGFHASNVGSTACSLCPLGTATNVSGTPNCKACDPGSFSAEVGKKSCKYCFYGTFNNRTGQTECQKCPNNTFAAERGQINCTVCAAGYSSIEGSRSCENRCTKGQFSPSQSVPCKNCSSGSFTDVSGSVKCLPCPAGFTAVSGSIKCFPCPANKVAERPGMPNCHNCPDKGPRRNNSACYEKLHIKRYVKPEDKGYRITGAIEMISPPTPPARFKINRDFNLKFLIIKTSLAMAYTFSTKIRSASNGWRTFTNDSPVRESSGPFVFECETKHVKEVIVQFYRFYKNNVRMPCKYFDVDLYGWT